MDPKLDEQEPEVQEEEEEQETEPGAEEEQEPQDEIEEWMKEGDEPDQPGSDSVPLTAHIRTKRRLKGRISEQSDRINALEAEIKELKGRRTETKLELPKRPRRDAFDDDDEYESALDKYEKEKDDIRFNNLEQASNLRTSQERMQRRIEENVNAHYARAEKLLESSGITAEAFRAADEAFRQAIEDACPGMGDQYADQIISRLGEGSEKTVFRVGRSKIKLGQVTASLAGDNTGLDLAAFLGKEQATLLNATKRKRSNAPPPDVQLNGDSNAGQKARILKKRYQDAHKKGKGQEAWNARKEAKDAGIDISGW